MKHINIIIAALFLLSMASCEKEEIPYFTIGTDKESYSLDEIVTFTIIGDAETFTIYTGDSLHYYDSSVAVITENQVIDQEITILPADSLDLVLSVAVDAVDKFNSRNDSLQVDTSLVKDQISALVGKEYYSIQEAQYDLLEILYFVTGYTSTIEKCMAYYTTDALYLAPAQGFSTGFPVDRYEKTFNYQYSKPGTYRVVAIATNVGEKQYSGSGYKEEREQSASDYDYYRHIEEISVTITP